jgi:hypothetical protein
MTRIFIALAALAILPGCKQLAEVNIGGKGSGETPSIKTEQERPSPPPKPEAIFVYTYSYEGLPITAGRVVEVHAPDSEFPGGSVTLEIERPEKDPFRARIDPRAWKIVKPSSPVKVLPDVKAETVPVN